MQDTISRKLLKPNSEGLGFIVATLFSDGYFSMKKGIWGYQIS